MIKVTAADYWFSMCVRCRSNWTCERCKKQYPPPTQALHCAHYYSRGNWAVRFDPRNATAACYGCHRWLDKGRISNYRPHLIETIGLEDVEVLETIAGRVSTGARSKTRLKEIAAHFRAEFERMDRYRQAGNTWRLQFVEFR